MTSGGKRPGAGRKPSPDTKKRITIRLPGWLIKWLKDSGRNQSKTIEDALIEKHGLKSPKTGKKR